MKVKVKLLKELKEKNLQIPDDIDIWEFNSYELNDEILKIYSNKELLKKYWYYSTGDLQCATWNFNKGIGEKYKWYRYK